MLDEDAGSVDLPPLQTQQQVAALQKALAEEEAETSKTSLGQAWPELSELDKPSQGCSSCPPKKIHRVRVGN